jgi:hypothetical protein
MNGNSELKLRFFKALVNAPLRIVDKILPEPLAVEYPQTKMLLNIYRQMVKAYRLDSAMGTFGAKPDGNFERFLRVSAKILARISEDDRYYRAWVGLAFILAHEQMSMFNEEVAEIKRLIRKQWLVDIDFLSDQAVILNRQEFLETALCDYLCNLARMETGFESRLPSQEEEEKTKLEVEKEN